MISGTYMYTCMYLVEDLFFQNKNVSDTKFQKLHGKIMHYKNISSLKYGMLNIIIFKARKTSYFGLVYFEFIIKKVKRKILLSKLHVYRCMGTM